MKPSQINNAALFLALALTAGPALAGVSHGGTTRASTDEYATVKLGESATAEKTVETPLVTKQVNIQPQVNADGSVVADPNAKEKLLGMDVKTDADAKVEAGSSMNNGGAPLAPGTTPNAGGRVKLQSGAKDGSAK